MNVFDLFAKLTLDSTEYENGLSDSEEKANKFGAGLKNALGTAAKVTTAAVGAASAAVAAFSKQAIEGYADYEQLVGGVETLFGDSAQTVIANANKAFQTAGLSANEYMETVTSFSASLLQSVGGDTQKAAAYADMALQDMSDNANKMGTSMDSIQAAYQGFAKQNYTMLDNLKLGYGGTKTEMERLVEDAEKLDSSFRAQRDESGNLALSYADVVDAIHIVQNEMGITGTTAKEASATISGSIGAMKSAWANLVTGIADENANFGELVNNFIGTLVGENGEGGVINNLIPRIQQTLNGVTELITAAAGQILPIVVSTIATNLPSLVQAGLDVVTSLGGAIVENLPVLIDAGLQIILVLSNAIIGSLPEMIPAIVEIILTIVEKLTEPDTLLQLISAALQIILALGEGLTRAIPQLLEAVPVILDNLIDAVLGFLDQIVETGGELIAAIAEGILEKAQEVYDSITEIVSNVKQSISDTIHDALEWGRDLINNFVAGITEKWEALKSKVSGVAQTVRDFLGFSEPKKGPLSNFHTFAPDMMELYAKGIKDNAGLVTSQLDSLARDAQASLAVSSAGFSARGSRPAATGRDTAKLEELMRENTAMLRQIASEFSGLRVKGRMAM